MGNRFIEIKSVIQDLSGKKPKNSDFSPVLKAWPLPNFLDLFPTPHPKDYFLLL